MNYYPFHIGDYASATRHLSWDEDGAYRRLLDVYYTSEKPIPTDHRSACRLVMAQTDGQREAVKVVLEEFFDLTEVGWVNKRADFEIAHMQDKQAKARASAEISVSIRKAAAEKRRADAERTLAQLQANVELPTPTPTPTPTPVKKKREAALPPVRPDDICEQVWKDWTALRKSKGAAVTETVLSAARAESVKAGLPFEQFMRIWCLRGSQGMDASWIKTSERTSFGAHQGEPAWRTEQRSRVAEFAGPAAARPMKTITEQEIFDASPRLVG